MSRTSARRIRLVVDHIIGQTARIMGKCSVQTMRQQLDPASTAVQRMASVEQQAGQKLGGTGECPPTHLAPSSNTPVLVHPPPGPSMPPLTRTPPDSPSSPSARQLPYHPSNPFQSPKSQSRIRVRARLGACVTDYRSSSTHPPQVSETSSQDNVHVRLRP